MTSYPVKAITRSVWWIHPAIYTTFGTFERLYLGQVAFKPFKSGAFFYMEFTIISKVYNNFTITDDVGQNVQNAQWQMQL